MVYDGFIFFNELELLKLRLEICANYVDHFILVESKYTFTNQEKQLYFENNKEKFEKYTDKIIHIVVDHFPDECETDWDREYYQRNQIMLGLKDAKIDDIIMVSDLDEIPSPSAWKRAKRFLRERPDKIWNLELLNCYYFLNYVEYDHFFWAAPHVCCVGQLSVEKGNTDAESAGLKKKRISTIQELRGWREVQMMPCAGWHFSYLGGIDRIIAKVQAFSHQEYNNEEYLNYERIQKMIIAGKDVFGREIQRFASIPIGYLMPKQIRRESDAYREYICSFNPMRRRTLAKLYIKYLGELTPGVNLLFKMKRIKHMRGHMNK